MVPFQLDAELSPIEETSSNPSDQIIVHLTIEVIHQGFQVIQGLKLTLVHI